VLGGPTVPSVIISAGTRGVSVNRNRLVMSLNRLVGFFMIFSPFLSGNACGGEYA